MALMLISCSFFTGKAPGAGGSALIGHQVGLADDNGNYQGKQLSYGRSLGGGLVESPYKPYNTFDTRGLPHGAVVEDPAAKGQFIKP